MAHPRAPFIFALLLGGCGSAISLPPAQFDYEPTGPFQDIRMPWRSVINACRTFGELRDGCTVPGNPPLRITANDLRATDDDAIIRHENGHLNGWRADHPGAHF